MAINISVELSHICQLEEIVPQVKALESSGFSRIWVPDTVVTNWEAWMAAGLIARETSTIEIGLGVTNPYTRHPVVAAQMAATLQNLSKGRLSLSIGKGIGRFLEKAGVEQYDSAVAECITLLRGLIAGERTSLDGQAFQVDAMQLRTSPPETPVPLYLAAIGPASWQAALDVADGIATIWGGGKTVELYNRAMAERKMPTAALIPFAQKKDDFFAQRISSLEELKDVVAAMDEAGLDEVIIGYAEMGDIESAAKLIG